MLSDRDRLEIAYNSLKGEPKPALRRILAYCKHAEENGLTLDPNMIAFECKQGLLPSQEKINE